LRLTLSKIEYTDSNNNENLSESEHHPRDGTRCRRSKYMRYQRASALPIQRLREDSRTERVLLPLPRRIRDNHSRRLGHLPRLLRAQHRGPRSREENCGFLVRKSGHRNLLRIVYLQRGSRQSAGRVFDEGGCYLRDLCDGRDGRIEGLRHFVHGGRPSGLRGGSADCLGGRRSRRFRDRCFRGMHI